MRKFKCVKYNSDERFFTLGEVYGVNKKKFINDRGFNYTSLCGGVKETLSFLKSWYEFEEIFSENEIKEVLYGTKTTIIKWSDGTQTEAVCAPEDNFDKQVGFAIAYTRKMNGGKLSE